MKHNGQIDRVTVNVSTSATHQCDRLLASNRSRAAHPRAAFERIKRQKTPRHDQTRAVPYKQLDEVYGDVRGGEAERKERETEPSAHLERAFIPAHPDAHRRHRLF